MTSRKAIVWGCATAFLLSLAGLAVLVLFVVHVSQDVKEVAISVDGVIEASVGQTFDLCVTVTNERPKRVLELSDIDIAEDYLKGFTVAAISPKPKSSMHVPIDNSRSFTFGARIPPGGSQTFIFTLRAEKPGWYRGDVDVCEGMRFISGMVQTLVREKE